MSKANQALFQLSLFLLLVLGFQMTGSLIFQITFPMVFGIFMAAIVIGTILYPRSVEFPRTGLAILWAVVYAIIRIPMTFMQAGVNGLAVAQWGLEIVLLVTGLLLISNLVEILQSFEVFQDKLFKPSPNVRIKHIKSNLEEITAEFTRCRRYNHTLSIVAVEAADGSEEDQPAKKSQKLLERKFVTLNLAEVISRQIRQFDMILIKDWNGRFYILCPENTDEGSDKLGQRINRIAESSIGTPIEYAWVLFPRDALTLEEMINQADLKLDNRHAFGKYPTISDQAGISKLESVSVDTNGSDHD